MPIICRIFDSRHIELSEQEANSRLILAAPDMVEALMAVWHSGRLDKSACLADIDHNGDVMMYSNPTTEAVRAAIAKAIGTNP